MRIVKLIKAVATIGVLYTFISCTPDPPAQIDPKDAQLAKLSKTWKIAAGVKPTLGPGNAPQNDFTNFQLTINGTPGQTSFGYTTTGFVSVGGSKSPWPSSGTLTFGTDFSATLIRDDGNMLITYSVSDTQLQMTFTYTGPGFGRVDNVNGSWIFSFIP